MGEPHYSRGRIDLDMDFPEKAIIGVLVGANGADANSIKESARAIPGARLIGLHDELDLSPASLLILDHALALLPRFERQQAATRLTELRRSGTTTVLISHDEELLEAICDELWWSGLRGAPAQILQAYRKHVATQMRESGNGKLPGLAPSIRRGDGRASIQGIELIGESGVSTVVWKSGESVVIRVAVRYETPVADPVIGMLIRTRIGLSVYGTNSELEQLRFGPCAAGETVVVTFAFVCDLCPGEYTLTVASHDPDGVWHEWLEDAVAFSVGDSRYTAGVANLRANVSVVRKS
jgi:lipopolysaccharide transport system ATP-binding protein